MILKGESTNLLREMMRLAGYKVPNKEEAHEKGICVKCGEWAYSRCKTELGLKEYAISGLCEVCWDDMFKDEDKK